MASADWIFLCGVLGAGLGALLSCREILRSGTSGRDALAADGFRQAVIASGVSSSARRWVAYARFCESHGIPEELTPPALSRGFQTEKKQHKTRGGRRSVSRIEIANSGDLTGQLPGLEGESK